MHGSLGDHDRDPAVPDQDPGVALTEALGRLQIQGAIFLHGEYTEPWAFSSVPTEDLAAALAPQARRVIPFHVIASGRCWIEVEQVRYWARAGDVIVLPYGHDHRMGGTEDAEVVDANTFVDPLPWTTMPFLRHGQGGSATSVVCGYITCEDPLFDPELRALPPVLVVSLDGPAEQWVRASIDYALVRAAHAAPDATALPSRIVQPLLTEVIKLHLAEAATSDIGFIRALHDPVVAPALAAMHATPGRKWTVAELAQTAHVSESLLDQRFRDVAGIPPIRYLSSWRMRLAQDLLDTTDLSVTSVARRVGFDSEEAFSRAFKRKHGTPPSVWRRRTAAQPRFV
jgi:AraC-like DNA-binding protein